MPTSPEPGPLDPHQEYSRRAAARRALNTRLTKHEAWLGNARVLVFVVAAIFVYLIFAARSMALGWLALPVAAFMGLSVWHERVRRRCLQSERACAFYEKGLAVLEDRWAGSGAPGARYLVEDHPYALDLDIFGAGSLYERLCAALTRAGGDTLASWLCSPASPDEVLARQQAVADLRARIDLREEIALLSAGVPEGVDLDALSRWGDSAPVLRMGEIRVAAACLVSLTLAALAVWFFGEIGPTPLLILLLGQGGFALRLQGRVRRVVEPIQRRAHDLTLFSGLLARIERGSFQAARLRQLQESLNTAGWPPSRRIAQLVRLIRWLDCTQDRYFDLASRLVLWTTQLAFAFEAWRAVSGQAIARWLAAAGEFEALCALAAYSYENPADPFPELVATRPCFEGEGLGHPLLPSARCIRNDLSLTGDLRVLVVSGSNMSGKSTLLRTVGVNTVLALAGAPVRARRLRLSPLAVGATLRLQDSLQAGHSRFYVEIKRVRQLVAMAEGPVPLLFLLDEIFHGTNSHDRRHGAEAVVRALVDLGAIGLVTTHDLALTHIADQLAPRAGNVHFEDRLEDGAITFDYHVRPGIVQHSNALALMRAVGLKV